MPPDEAADILGDLSEERSQAVLEAMEEDEAEDVRELLAFREDSAGGLMTTEFFRAAESLVRGGRARGPARASTSSSPTSSTRCRWSPRRTSWWGWRRSSVSSGPRATPP